MKVMKTIRFLMSLVLFCSFAYIAEAAKVELLIIPPDNDGGATLVGYYVDYLKVGDSRWIRSNKDPIPAIQVEVNGKFEYAAIPYPVDGLEIGFEYQFRVHAENIYLSGKPGRATRPIKIDSEYIGNIRVKCEDVDNYRPSRMFENGNISAIPEKGMMYRKEEDMV